MSSENQEPTIEHPAVCDHVKASIEQAKDSFLSFIDTSEKQIQNAANGGNVSLALNEKILEIAREDAEANFGLALKLVDAVDVSEVVKAQNEHAKWQMSVFAKRAGEIQALTNVSTAEAAAPAAEVVAETSGEAVATEMKVKLADVIDLMAQKKSA